MSRKRKPPKKAAARARRAAHQELMASRRERCRGLSAADLVAREFNEAGTARRERDRKEPV